MFSALADPTRRRILERLSAQGESCVGDLANPFGISPPAISKHLRVLENARLVKRRRRGREILIRVNAGGMIEAQTWIAHCMRFWESSFEGLDELLEKQKLEAKGQ